MPCDGSHLNPNQYEEESKRAAELLVFAYKLMRKTCPGWITKAAKEYYGDPEKVDELIELLCATCKTMKHRDKNRIIYNGRNPTSRRLADWWDEHQEIDKKKAKKKK